MTEPSRPRHVRQGGWEQSTADEVETWRSQDLRQGYSPGREGGHHSKKNLGGPYRASPKKGGLGPLSSSLGAFRSGHSPSQRDGFRRFPVPESSVAGRDENWRERMQQQQNLRKTVPGGGLKEDWEQGRKDSSDTIHNSGGKRRNRDRRRAFGEEDRGPVIDESTLSAKELLGLQQAEERLTRDEIFRLKKRSRSNPNALYTCTLCDVMLESVSAAHRHIKDKWHKRRAREKREQAMLTEILPPGKEHITAVSITLNAVVREHGMSDQDAERRCSIVCTMQDLLVSVLPEIKLRLYGSSCTKFGFKDSDINIDIQYPPHMHQPDVLLLVQESLSLSPLFDDLEADFHARVPVVICKEKKSGLLCKVSAGNDNACLTTSFLSVLASQEPLLHPLVLGFRHWARICQVDRSEEGGLPPYVFGLMVIYFLQQRKDPLLPAYLNHEIRGFSLSKLPHFSLKHVEDGCVHWVYAPGFAESSQPTQDSGIKGKTPLVFNSPSSSEDIGLLWVEMLRFYSLEFNMADNVISVRTSVLLSREAKDWPKKRIAVEDPFSVKRNVARTVNSQQMYEYILHCLKTTYKYFALPLNTLAANHKMEKPKGPFQGLSNKAVSEDTSHLSCFQAVTNETQAARTFETEEGPHDSDCIIEEEVEEEPDLDEDGGNEKVDLGKSSLSEDEGDEEDELEEDCEENMRRLHLDSLTTEDEEIFPLDEISGEELLSDEEGPDLDTPGSMDDEEEEMVPASLSQPDVKDTTKDEGLEKKNHEQTSQCYEFTRQAFTRGKTHMVVCSLCKRDGHLKKDCPEDFKKVELEPLPPMTSKFLKTLNQICEQCYQDFAPEELEVSVRENILQDLESFVRWQFAGASLRLFGSSRNGFGFRQSDLDICMVMEGQDTADDLDCISIIESLARLLKKHPGLRNILPITTAKVPIVKFYHVRTGLEGDISLYNTLALHNTHLLASYALIDKRVKLLCYVMKVFAKMCDIGDASRGSLSSYAYTLMVLFFLQQRNPPVIPVLQEIYDGEKKPEILVDGWNVYFFDDLKALPGRWPQYGRNTETVGALWLGLLRFYTEDFDFKEHVVCIRQQARLTTFNKQWTSKYIVIEDPFDLNHNLGAGLSRRMTNFIMKAFINGRRVFGTPVIVYPPEYPNHMEYFFDPEVLTEGELAPNDRCCRICGKIGHFMKDCPMRKKSKHRRDSEKRTEHARERPEAAEGTKEQMAPRGDRWRRQEEKRCCFLCGSQTHIKKDCLQYRGPAGNTKLELALFSSSPSSSSGHVRNLREKEKQGIPLQEEKKKRKQQNVILGPQAGSLASRHMGRSGHRRSPVE
ncbi:terminal uridylyltransferase 7 [Lampris incognitus]|uniref:terminal uridylyltransferase 7 n=1 Tax=Lampris incognitus TaxID=2546036 RepID=UPI0024B4818D|nr:terminal uridylyltransferase 7 [Lampris incognitus]